MSDGSHLPVQDSNHPRFRLVEDKIVDLIIAMYESAAVSWLRGLFGEERHHLVEVRDLAHGNLCLDVHGPRLCEGNCAEGFQLTVVESGGSAEIGEVDRGRGYAVEGREGQDSGSPPVTTVQVSILPFRLDMLEETDCTSRPSVLPRHRETMHP